MARNAAQTLALLVLRHGKTEWNRAGLLQGRTDIPLSEDGRRDVRGWRCPQAFALAPVVSSPLVRAKESALILFRDRLTEKNLSLDQDLVEASFGDFEGQSSKSFQSFSRSGAEEWRGLDFAPPKGECLRSVRERVENFLGRASMYAQADGKLVVVSHKAWIYALFSLAWGWEFDRKPPHKIDFSRAHEFVVEGKSAKELQVRVAHLNIELTSPPGEE